MDRDWIYIGGEAIGMLRALHALRKLPATQIPQVEDILRRWEAAIKGDPKQQELSL